MSLARSFLSLRASALTGPHAGLDGLPSVEQGAGTPLPSCRVGARPLPGATGRAHSGPPSAAPWEATGAEISGRYTPEQIEAIHDQAIDRAEQYIDVPTAIVLYEHWTVRS